MKKLNILEAKTHLSKYLSRLKKGARIILCRRNEPIAEILPLSPPRTARRSIGGDSFKVGAAFFEPLSEEDLLAFEGKRE